MVQAPNIAKCPKRGLLDQNLRTQVFNANIHRKDRYFTRSVSIDVTRRQPLLANWATLMASSTLLELLLSMELSRWSGKY